MTDAKLLEVISKYETELPPYMDWLTKAGEAEKADHIEHVIGMLPQMRQFVIDARREKLMRWLGYAQGVLVTCGMYSLDTVKNHNKPNEEVATA